MDWGSEAGGWEPVDEVAAVGMEVATVGMDVAADKELHMHRSIVNFAHM